MSLCKTENDELQLEYLHYASLPHWFLSWCYNYCRKCSTKETKEIYPIIHKISSDENRDKRMCEKQTISTLYHELVIIKAWIKGNDRFTGAYLDLINNKRKMWHIGRIYVKDFFTRNFIILSKWCSLLLLQMLLLLH